MERRNSVEELFSILLS